MAGARAAITKQSPCRATDQVQAGSKSQDRKSARPRRGAECLLLAQSGHGAAEFRCPLLGVKQTSQIHTVTSAFDPKRTLTSNPPYPFRISIADWYDAPVLRRGRLRDGAISSK